MTPTSSRTYRTGEFARLAGVTPRALHHYDRLGLLKPHRSAAGYRVYAGQDLERLVQIMALKLAGIPLRKIRRLLSSKPGELAIALNNQRLILQERVRLLEQTIGAIRDAETAIQKGGPVAPDLYRRIIEVIDMQSKSDWNAKYQELLEAKVTRLRTLTPEDRETLRREWAVLFDEIRQALTDDPAGPRAQQLAARWLDLLGRLMGRPVDRSMIAAGASYEGGGTWAPSEADKSVWEFMKKALSRATPPA